MFSSSVSLVTGSRKAKERATRPPDAARRAIGERRREALLDDSEGVTFRGDSWQQVEQKGRQTVATLGNFGDSDASPRTHVSGRNEVRSSCWPKKRATGCAMMIARLALGTRLRQHNVSKRRGLAVMKLSQR